MKDNSVSVVIPVHNHGSSLGSALSSVRAQAWPSLEIIIIDDGSTDDTAAVIRALRAPDLRVWHQSNQGPAEARNAGIREARNAWIGFLDADDLWLPDKLRIQFERLSQSPAATFCYGDAWVEEPSGAGFLFSGGLPQHVLRAELLFGNRLATPTVLVRRDCLSSAGLFDRSLQTGEDWDLWLRLAWRFEGAPASKPLARVHRTLRHRPPLPTLERCTFRVLDNFFSSAAGRGGGLPVDRESVYAWHRAVLAKSSLRSGDIPRFVRLLCAGLVRRPKPFLRALGGQRLRCADAAVPNP